MTVPCIRWDSDIVKFDNSNLTFDIACITDIENIYRESLSDVWWIYNFRTESTITDEVTFEKNKLTLCNITFTEVSAITPDLSIRSLILRDRSSNSIIK